MIFCLVFGIFQDAVIFSQLVLCFPWQSALKNEIAQTDKKDARTSEKIIQRCLLTL